MNNLEYFTLGVCFSIIYILGFFGNEIKCKSDPKIKINIPPFVRNSHLYIFNKHIHHWFLNTIILCIISFIQFFIDLKIFYFIRGFNIIQILHGLLYQDCFDFSLQNNVETLNKQI
jgi:hypothetical protein